MSEYNQDLILEQERKIKELEQQRDKLVAAAQAFLDASNAEARASMTYANAQENFTDSKLEWDVYKKALIVSSKADAELRAALAKVKT